MHEPGWIDLPATRHRLEREAATLLGLMLFEYSRLDAELALHLVWAEEGKDLEQATKRLDNTATSSKLKYMRQCVDKTYPVLTRARYMYKKWLKELDEIRLLRNDLVHGRWGPWGYGEGVSNVIGIPTSDEQREVHYTIEQLAQILERIKKCRMDHVQLRTNWPL